jgi:hypothetical protein
MLQYERSGICNNHVYLTKKVTVQEGSPGVRRLSLGLWDAWRQNHKS